MSTGREEDTQSRSVSWGLWLDRLGRFPVLPLLYVLVKYRLGMGSLIRVHDNLDHFAALYDRMSLADAFAPPSSTLDFVLGGLPRDMVGSEFFVGILTGAVLPLVWALVVSEVVTRLVAYYGMRRLLRMTGLASERFVYLGVPLVFSVLPFFHPVVASVAGIPLLLSALIGLHRRPSRTDYTILALFPAISWAGATVPYVVLVGGYALGGTVLRLVPRAVMRGAGVFAGALVVIEWRLVYSLLAGPQSHRLEIGGAEGVPDPAALSGAVYSLGRNLLELLEKHAAHSVSAITPLSVVLVVVVLTGTGVLRRRPNSAARVLIVVLSGMVAILIAARIWPYFDTYVVSRFVDLPHFQMERIVWALPGLAYLGLAAAATALVGMVRAPVTALVLVAVFVVQGAAAWQLADFNRPERAQITIDEFYAPGVFAEVMSLVVADGSGGRVVSVGFHPHVAVYNGFDTADGYWYSYPLEYKHRFRALIAPALEQAPDLAAYFDDWGSRAYLFQPALGIPDCCRVEVSDSYDLLVDVAAFDDLGIRYVLSNGEVSNADALGFRFLGEATRQDSRYDIFVYAVP